jgi:hypothetical protein
MGPPLEVTFENGHVAVLVRAPQEVNVHVIV